MTKNELRDKFQTLASNTPEISVYCRQAVHYIKECNPHYDWVGIYISDADALKIPDDTYYVGPTTQHTVIPYNEGICGAAATQRKTIIVDDVNQDPRFIACSLKTQSEIVVPIQNSETLFGVLDLDSDTAAAFTPEDQQLLEDAASFIAAYFQQHLLSTT